MADEELGKNLSMYSMYVDWIMREVKITAQGMGQSWMWKEKITIQHCFICILLYK